MDLTYSQEQQMLRDNAFRFVEDGYDFDARKRFLAHPEGFDRAIWRQFAELGWTGIAIPEPDGGFGGGAVELSIIMEALGSVLAVEPYLQAMTLGAGALVAAGQADQRSLLGDVVAGDALLAFAHGEQGARNNSANVATSATRSGTGWLLSGVKTMVANASAVSHVIVSARMAGKYGDRNGIGLFLLPAGIPGISINSYRLLDGRLSADVSLDNVQVGMEMWLGRNDDAIDIIEALIDVAIVAGSAYVLGGMDVLLKATKQYVDQRVQFGRPLGRFQVVQHNLAEMLVRCREARAITLLAIINAAASPQRRARGAAAAKVKVGEASRFVGYQAVQLHGGMGVSDELNVGTYLKHFTIFDQTMGTPAHHLHRYDRLIAANMITVSDGLIENSAS